MIRIGRITQKVRIKFIKALLSYQEAVKQSPINDHAHYLLGKAYERKGLLDKALEEYENAILLAPVGRSGARPPTSPGRAEKDWTEEWVTGLRLKYQQAYASCLKYKYEKKE